MRYLALLVLLLPFAAQAEEGQVVVGIRPIAGIVAAVTEGVSAPYVLTKGNTSPHLYQLAPRDLKELKNAKLIVWVGPELETFMPSVLRSLKGRVPVLELVSLPDLKLYDARQGGVWEEHDHGDNGATAAHDHGPAKDSHIWLDPMNGIVIAKAIAAKLAELDPVNAARYLQNAEKFTTTIKSLDKELAAQLKPFMGKGYIVFHDAYQGFEQRYGVYATGAITVSPEQTPSAQRVKQVREKIKSLGAVCVFTEPQFSSKLAETLVEGTTAKRGVLDADGGAMEVSPMHYVNLLKNVANSLSICLK
jgi:zinc transport system substrate-binding protein